MNATDVAGWLGLAVALGSLWYARKAHTLAYKQDLRSRPSLGIYLEDSYVLKQPDETDRIFAILIMVSNRSDAPNSIARVELEVIYSVGDQTEIPLRLPSTDGLASLFPGHHQPPLLVPADLSPRHAIKGWCYFRMPTGMIPQGSRVLDQALLIGDADDAIHQAKPELLNEIAVPKTYLENVHIEPSA